MIDSGQPGAGISKRSLEDAYDVLTGMADVCVEEDDHVPAWITAARRATLAEIRRRDE